MFLRALPRLLFQADGGQPQGGSAPAPAPDPAQGLQGLLSRHNGDGSAVAALLYHDNYQLREQLRAARASQPGEGSVILSAADAAAWQAYRQLGAADALAQQLAQLQAVQGELSGLKRQSVIREAAELAGYKPAVLARLLGDAPVEIRETDGTKSVVIREGETERPLAEHAAQQWADFLPALAAAPAAPAPAPGVPFPSQQQSGAPGAGGLDAALARYQQQRDAAYNPLAPKLPPTP